jgi:ketosteroid isomerase-like protein
MAFLSQTMSINKPIYTSAADAEAAFYDALARSDLDAMMSVWSEDEEIVCIHPGGPRIVGLEAIREVWRQILSGGARLEIDITQNVVSGNAMVAVHSVFENIRIAGESARPQPIAATNVFMRGALGWRMVMHHASPVPDSTDFGDLSPRVVH